MAETLTPLALAGPTASGKTAAALAIARHLQGRMPVELPQAAGAKDADARNPLLVTLTRGGEVYWGDRPGPVPSVDIAALVRENAGKREILVAGDRGVSYGEVVGLLDELQRAGVERLGLALQGQRPQGSVRTPGLLSPEGTDPVSLAPADVAPEGHAPR